MINVSIVSHRQFPKVLEAIKSFSKISKNDFFFVVTINVKEIFSEKDIYSLVGNNYKLIINKNPKGFGENHNFASRKVKDGLFIICNPDIVIKDFNLKSIENINYSGTLYAPKLIDTRESYHGYDFRVFPSLSRVFIRQLMSLIGPKRVLVDESSNHLSWFPGYFMIIDLQAFKSIGGFDESFFMYCEDVDLCLRIKKNKFKIKKMSEIVISHEGQYASNKDLSFFFTHMKSLLRLNIYRALGRYL